MLFDENRLLVIAGPCALESDDMAFDISDRLLTIQQKFPEIQIVFKASFDKANRSSVDSLRGVGIDVGLDILNDIKHNTSLPVTTDIHRPEQASVVSEVCDIIQIPAFLCRQTDLISAAADTGKVVSVKKGQFLSPNEMQYVISKLHSFGADEVWPIERGTTFGYNNLVVDMRTFPIMRKFSPVAIFDATHSVQQPGAGNGITIGQRQFVEILAYSAISAGANGVFFEVHNDPDNAISDAANQLDINCFDGVIDRCLKFWKTRKNL